MIVINCKVISRLISLRIFHLSLKKKKGESESHQRYELYEKCEIVLGKQPNQIIKLCDLRLCDFFCPLSFERKEQSGFHRDVTFSKAIYVCIQKSGFQSPWTRAHLLQRVKHFCLVLLNYLFLIM